jgi:hypothetical protein
MEVVMTVEFWYGTESQYRSEQSVFSDLYAYLASQPDQFWLLTNFHAGNNEIDLVIIKQRGVFIAELKHIWSPIKGGKNGPWRFERYDGTLQDFRNPYQQVRQNTYDWKNWIYARREQWLAPAHLSWPEKSFMPYSYVVISPTVADGSDIQIHPDFVEVKGLEQFKADLKIGIQPGIDLSREEVQRLLTLLNLNRKDGGFGPTLLLAQPIKRPGVRQLVPFGDNAGTEVIKLEKTKITVGRDADNDLVLNDNRVSGRHAIITFQDDWWTVEDVGSKNGTYVRYNGESTDERKIKDANALKDGSIVRFGPCYFRLMIVEPAPVGSK